ncbi:MAG: bifunctional histidinol-phosphatase/imidazoleglycerol-phosphate dehydratase HisB [Hydrotalea sp.]|nr:bifunctional histidinol-phosphatase/imidazoleglycerol-phosphate dehydratase HisB [Hydrotalea sp.]
MKSILFLDRDGVILQEPPQDFQIDHIDKTSFVPGSISALSQIASQFDFHKVLVTNQDGLGTSSYPEDTFWPFQNLMLRTLEGEGFVFDEICIDRSFASDPLPTRKPGIGMVQYYLNNPNFDLNHSFVVGDRLTDMQLAKNIGCKGILILNPLHNYDSATLESLTDIIALKATSWTEIVAFLKLSMRTVDHQRYTNETKIDVSLNMDGTGKADIHTGLGFFDHMLDQIARHGSIDLAIRVQGDLHIDEHHTIEDTGLALGEAFAKALLDKRGMERYGFALPMDEASAKVLIDFGGRPWIVWNASFSREKIGDMPTEMFFHFFKSFSDAAKCNLHIECTGDNEHHKIESIFKAFAKAIRMAVKRNPFSNQLPSTKGVL